MSNVAALPCVPEDAPLQTAEEHAMTRIPRLRLAAFSVACLVPFAFATVPALAAGGYGGGSDTGSGSTPVCKKGSVYDRKTQKCVKQSGANLSDDDLADYAYALAKAERYQEALEVLDTVKDQNSPEVLNYRGYATRKLGRLDEGIGYYLKSVAADPQYTQVREYLGEAYVQKGEIGLAKAQLQAIAGLCGTSCEEYRDLDSAINAAPKI